jgi:acetolactate synthase-1/2/3 large subunit
MKLAEAVAKFIEAQGIRHVFGVSGGANLHLIHGIANATKIQFIPTAHEQGASFAADAYARVSGLGCAMATSGPGATNLITGIATSYYDSVPVLYITGNVATHRFGSQFGVRQYGFQETPIVEMVRHITKYANQLTEARALFHILDRAMFSLQAGRKGPVLIDIPDDLQRAEV